MATSNKADLIGSGLGWAATRIAKAARWRALNVSLSLLGALTLAAPAQAQSRGELLYGTHCIGCHTAQVHWRDGKLATDWTSLEAQVRRWQGATLLQWNDEDVRDVTRYLNDSYYRFAPAAAR